MNKHILMMILAFVVVTPVGAADVEKDASNVVVVTSDYSVGSVDCFYEQYRSLSECKK